MIKPGDTVHLIKPEFSQPMVWVVPPGVTHITVSRTSDGEVLEKRAVKPGQIVWLGELNARAEAKPVATFDVIDSKGIIR